MTIEAIMTAALRSWPEPKCWALLRRDRAHRSWGFPS